MGISIEHIVGALIAIGGEGTLEEITKEVCRLAPLPHPKDPSASVRARLQERCSEAKSYLGRIDLFESVHGVKARRGIWRLKSHPVHRASSEDILDGTEAFVDAIEGRKIIHLHLRRERSSKLIRAFKNSLATLNCEACGINFNEAYGDLGRDYIEAHHRTPLASRAEARPTTLADLAALCSNCHRIIHLNSHLTVEQLADHIRLRGEHA